MKIVVALASRERPLGLIGVVASAHRLASGQHDVRYVLGVDDDDTWNGTVGDVLRSELGDAVSFAGGPAPVVRGQIENRLMAAARQHDPDLVTLLSDRTMIISQRWDAMLAAAVAKEPRRVMFWSCPDDPGCIIPLAGKAYLDAINWRWDDEIHPYWYTDTAQQEIDLLLHGIPSLKVKAFYAGARGKTRNARDFGFWLDVFTATRDRRRLLAAHIAHALKIEMKERSDVEQYFKQYDVVMRERIKVFEDNFGDQNPPDENYLAAKARAEELLAQTNGTGTKAA